MFPVVTLARDTAPYTPLHTPIQPSPPIYIYFYKERGNKVTNGGLPRVSRVTPRVTGGEQRGNAEIAARRAAIGDTRDWREAARRLAAAGFTDGVIQRAEAGQ